MINKFIFLISLVILFSACRTTPNPNDGLYGKGPYCVRIQKDLHTGMHRRQGGRERTAIEKFRLWKESEKYGCDIY